MTRILPLAIAAAALFGAAVWWFVLRDPAPQVTQIQPLGRIRLNGQDYMPPSSCLLARRPDRSANGRKTHVTHPIVHGTAIGAIGARSDTSCDTSCAAYCGAYGLSNAETKSHFLPKDFASPSRPSCLRG